MKKKLWLVIPAAILQYVAIGVLCFIFFSSKSAFLREIMQTVFGNNALMVLLLLLLFAVLSGIFVIIFSVIAMKGDYDALFVAKTAMIMKLIQIPAYIAIFVLAVLLAISLLTIPFAVALMILDMFTLVLTGLLNTTAVFLAVRQKLTTWNHSIWILLLQFVFCADVAASIVFYVRLRQVHTERKNCCDASLEKQEKSHSNK